MYTDDKVKFQRSCIIDHKKRNFIKIQPWKLLNFYSSVLMQDHALRIEAGYLRTTSHLVKIVPIFSVLLPAIVLTVSELWDILLIWKPICHSKGTTLFYWEDLSEHFMNKQKLLTLCLVLRKRTKAKKATNKNSEKLCNFTIKL